MPTYDYECPACSHRFEHFSRLHDVAPRQCPRCGKKKAKRLIGAGAGFIFKGSGFYTTDSRKPSGGNGDSAKPESKSDAKPALKGSEARPSGTAAATPSESKPKKKSD